jgi:hypothetical protein
MYTTCRGRKHVHKKWAAIRVSTTGTATETPVLAGIWGVIAKSHDWIPDFRNFPNMAKNLAWRTFLVGLNQA